MPRTGRNTPLSGLTVRLLALAVLAFLAVSLAGGLTGSAAHAATAAQAASAGQADTTAFTQPAATAAPASASKAATEAWGVPGSYLNGSPPPAADPNTASCDGATGQNGAWNPYLALDRWSNGTSGLHVRLKSLVNFSLFDGFSINNPIAYLTNGALDDWFLTAGDFAWATNEGLAKTAEQYCVIGKFGGAVDQTAGSLGKMLFDPAGGTGTIALVLVAGGIILLAARAMRGLGTGAEVAKYLLKAGAILGLAFFMLAGAAQTTNQSASGNSTTFGRGSPGWFMNVINNTVTTVGSGLGGSINPPSALWYTPAGGADGGTGPGTCDYFMNQMHADYSRVKDGSPTANAISQMWESSGLLLWTRAQMGTGAATPATDRSFCFVLDMMSGIQGSPQGTTAPSADTSYAAGGSTTFDPAATTYVMGGWSRFPAKEQVFDIFNNTASAQEIKSSGISTDQSDGNIADWFTHRIDITGAGYVLCEPSGSNWVVDPAMDANYMSGGQLQPGDCRNDFTGNLHSTDSSHLNIQEGTENQISPVPAGLLDFIGSWHGVNNNGVSLMASLAYMIASLVMLVVFGAISLGVIVAKTLLIVSAMFLFFLLLLELAPGGESRLPKFFRFTAACALSTVALSLLLEIIGKITWFVSDVAGGIAGPGSVFSMIAYAFAPVVAVAIVHVGFTHLLRLPSPVKLSSAMKYASAGAGGYGTSAAGGLESFGRYVKNRAEYGIARRGLRSGRRGLRSMFSDGPGTGAAFGAAGSGRQPAYSAAGAGGESGIGSFDPGAKRSGAVEAALRRTAKETGDPALTPEKIDEAREKFFADPENQDKIQEKLGEQRQEERRARREQRREALVQGMMNAPLRTTMRGAKKAARTGLKAGLATGLIAFGGPAGAGIVAASVGRRLVKARYERNRAVLARHDNVWTGSEDFRVLQEKVAQAASKRRRMVRDQAREQAGQPGPGPLPQPPGGNGPGNVQGTASRRKASQQPGPGNAAPSQPAYQPGREPGGPVASQPGPSAGTARAQEAAAQRKAGSGGGQSAGDTHPGPQTPRPRQDEPGDTGPGQHRQQPRHPERGGPAPGNGEARNQVEAMKDGLPRPGRDVPRPGGDGQPA